MSSEQASELLQKLCLLYLCSAICCGAGPAVQLNADDEGILCEVMLLAYRHRGMAPPSSSSTQQLQALTARSHGVMMARIT